MILEHLSIINYKNIQEATLELSPNINCFIGHNGAGKTNVLDAVYFLSFCHSAQTTQDSLVIRHDQDFFMLEGEYQTSDLRSSSARLLPEGRKNPQNSTFTIHCGMKRGTKKVFRRDKKAYQRLSEHIGLIPIVLISPADIQLIEGSSEERRRLMDVVISQLDHPYLESLNRYNKALQQRVFNPAGFADGLSCVLSKLSIQVLVRAVKDLQDISDEGNIGVLIVMPALGACTESLVIVISVFADFLVNGDITADIEAFLHQQQRGEKTGYASVSVPEGMDAQKIDDDTGCEEKSVDAAVLSGFLISENQLLHRLWGLARLHRNEADADFSLCIPLLNPVVLLFVAASIWCGGTQQEFMEMTKQGA